MKVYESKRTILGVDPSLNSTGWAIITQQNNAFSLVDYGVLSSSSSDPDYITKVGAIGSGILDIIKKYGIKELAMEKTVCNKNPSSSLKLGMVRGAVMLAAHLNEATLEEYEPKIIKKALVGNGNAEKEQVAFMVKQILGRSFVDVVNSKSAQSAPSAPSANQDSDTATATKGAAKGVKLKQTLKRELKHDITDAIGVCITHCNIASSPIFALTGKGANGRSWSGHKVA